MFTQAQENPDATLSGEAYYFAEEECIFEENEYASEENQLENEEQQVEEEEEEMLWDPNFDFSSIPDDVCCSSMDCARTRGC
jgi:hypothetical protein